MSKTESNENDSEGWDKTWTRICEMEAGPRDPFEEFADDVLAAMEDTGNEVGRPLVMKVSVEVAEGELRRPDDGDETRE